VSNQSIAERPFLLVSKQADSPSASRVSAFVCVRACVCLYIYNLHSIES